MVLCKAHLSLNHPSLSTSLPDLEDTRVVDWVDECEVVISVDLVELDDLSKVVDLATSRSLSLSLALLGLPLLVDFVPVLKREVINFINFSFPHEAKLQVLLLQGKPSQGLRVRAVN